MKTRNLTLYLLLFLSSLLSTATAQTEKPILSLVMDDLGYSLHYGEQAFELEGEHTYAIIPNSLHAKTLAEIAQREQKEIIMHLPMQSKSLTANHEESTLTTAMNEDLLIGITQKFLNEMPYIKGVNNHMGSYLTQHPYMMRPIMETIYRHNPSLYFLDSRTTAKSTAYTEAIRSGLTASKRNVFLDHNPSPIVIKHQFKVWLEKAKNNQSAIAIAHPVKSTLDVLAPLLKAESENVQFLPLSQYLPLQQKRTQEIKPWHPTHLSRLHKVAKTSKPSP